MLEAWVLHHPLGEETVKGQVLLVVGLLWDHSEKTNLAQVNHPSYLDSEEIAYDVPQRKWQCFLC